MPRIHFTVNDLARTRLRTTLGPVTDAVLALGALRHPGHRQYEEWRAAVNARLREVAGLVPVLAAPRSKIRAPDDLLSLVDRTAPAPAFDPPPQQVNVAVLTAWRMAVAPYWERVRAYLEMDCDRMGRIAMSHGVDGLLAMLHPGIDWTPPVLDVPGEPARDVHLGGGGLLLTPSVFLLDRPGLYLGGAGKENHPALVVSSPLGPEHASTLWREVEDPGEALGALIGQTRAAALRELTTTRTTRQLAERLGISSAGASQHTSVLRQAGLISTRRLRNTALHTVTALGMALLHAPVR